MNLSLLFKPKGIIYSLDMIKQTKMLIPSFTKTDTLTDKIMAVDDL